MMKKINSSFLQEISFLSDLQKDFQEKYLYFVETRTKDKDAYQHRLWKINPENNTQEEVLPFQEKFNYFFDEEGLWIYTEKDGITSFTLDSQNKNFSLPYSVCDVRRVKDHIWLLELETFPAGKSNKEEEEVHVFTEVPFLSNGEGIVHGKRRSLFLFHKEDHSLQPISAPYLDVNSYEIGEDGVLFSGEEFHDLLRYRQHVYEYSFRNKECTRLSREEMYITQVYYQQGKVYILGSSGKRYGLDEIAEPQLLEKGRYSSLYQPEISAFNGIITDVSYGKTTPFFAENGKHYLIGTENASANLYEIGAAGYQNLTKIQGSVESAVIFKGKIYFIGLWQQNLAEIYRVDQEITPCSCFNTALQKNYYVAKPQPLSFRYDNPLQAWALLPETYDKEKSYPSILVIHGGPQGAYSTVFVHELQVWAALGYIVYFGNPNGSCGKGNEFGSLREGWGYKDYYAILDIIRQARTDFPNIDKDRMALTGGSYGGYMTNWIISHNHNFCCAVSQRSICNWISEAYASDDGLSILQELPVKDPRIFHSQLWDMSPLKYVDNVKTPTLFIHAQEDYRCSLAEGYQFYTALKYRQVASKFILFTGENHDLSRCGKPKNRIRRLAEITAWFETYCKK